MGYLFQIRKRLASVREVIHTRFRYFSAAFSYFGEIEMVIRMQPAHFLFDIPQPSSRLAATLLWSF